MKFTVRGLGFRIELVQGQIVMSLIETGRSASLETNERLLIGRRL